MADIDEKLKEIEAGLKGREPSAWLADHGDRRWEIRDGDDIVCQSERGRSTGLWDARNFQHIARLSPDFIRDWLAHTAVLKAERAAILESHGNALDALSAAQAEIGRLKEALQDAMKIAHRNAIRAITESPPKPEGETISLTADIVPYSSIVGGGLMLKTMDGRAAFIINFMGTTAGVTEAETAALSNQFRWFIHNYGCYVPARALTGKEG